MNRQLFRYLSYLLFLFPIPCFVASVSTISAAQNVAQQKSEDKNRDMTFFEAAKNNNMGKILELLENGTDPYAQDEKGNKALDLATTNSNVWKLLKIFEPDPEKRQKEEKLFHELLKKTTNKNRLLVYGYIRKFEGKEKTIPKNIQNLCLIFYHMRASPSSYTQRYFFDKIKCKVPINLDILNVCLENYALENIRNQDNYTPFLEAVKSNKLEVAMLLKKWGADVNAENREKINALHIACCSLARSKAMVTWLLDVCNINIESKASNGATPLIYAMQYDHLKIAFLLKDRGANIYIKDVYGRTPREYFDKNKYTILLNSRIVKIGRVLLCIAYFFVVALVFWRLWKIFLKALSNFKNKKSSKNKRRSSKKRGAKNKRSSRA